MQVPGAMSKRRSNSRDAMVTFLMERVVSNQGISLEKLAGHLSQLPYDLRTKYGCSVESLKVFLDQFPKVFDIRNQRNVYVRNKSRQETSSLNGSANCFITSTSDRTMDGEDVACLNDITGTVYRMFSMYGFISINHPIKASVYFDVKAFDNAKHTSLLSSGLHVGDSVIFDARVGPKHCEARYRATRVTPASMATASTSQCLSLLSVHDVGGADGDTKTDLVNQHGVIEMVKPNYGFIKFGPNQRERAFFHAKNVDRSLGLSIQNLADVFTVEDKVRFSAKPSKRPSDKVKWEATTVHLCRFSNNGAADTEDDLGSEVFMSDVDSDIYDLLLAKLEEEESREAGLKESPEGCADSYSISANAASFDSKDKEKRNPRLLLEWERRQKLSGQRGCFYPLTESVGEIKFGPDRGLAACAAVEVTYQDKELVENLLWELADGQEVNFDAVEAEDSTWIATLVWIGERPATPLVGDCEAVFNRITYRSRGADEPLPTAEPSPHDGFATEMTLHNVVAESQPSQPSLSIYKGVKGVIVHVKERIGTCQVEQLPVSKKIEFTSECFYKDGTVYVGDLNAVLREGDTVFLDYMVSFSGTQEEIRCDLVWQGTRPKGVRQSFQINTHARATSLCFEDFETEVERADETSRGASRGPLEIGLQEDTVPSRGSAASSWVSEAGLLSSPPAVTSTPNYMHYPGEQNESFTSERAPDVSFQSAVANDEVLLRLSRMVAAEIIAEEERLRVVLRDVGVQTVYEAPLPSPSSRPDGPFPPLVSSTTQTISTGEIKSEGLFNN